MINFNDVKGVYFLGIGGIGVSAVAKMFLEEGKEVYGSDTSASEITDELKKEGAHVLIGQDVSHIPGDTDLVVYTIAIEKFAPDFLKQVRQRFKNVISYPESLSIISKEKYTIAICGTHGKTTTTAMVAKILIDAKMNPTVIVGSIMSDVKSNFVAGKAKSARLPSTGEAAGYLVVEACEYCRSFLEINPTVIGITTIDDDHMDYYKDSADILSAFKEFVSKVPDTGMVVGNQGDKNINEVLNTSKSKVIDAENYFDEHISLKVPGLHNKKNASVALAIADFLGIKMELALKSISEFSGTWRRFEYKGETALGAKVYDDYGHHPTEIKATISGAREMFPGAKIFVIFQPHLFSRTKSLLSEFQRAFDGADKSFILPIYPAREEFDPTISSEDIVSGSDERAVFIRNFDEVAKTVQSEAKEGDVILVMGAGDVYKVSELLTNAAK